MEKFKGWILSEVLDRKLVKKEVTGFDFTIT